MPLEIGAPLHRRDGRAKVTGTATFTAEWPVPEAAHAAAVTSPIPRGRITRVDTRAATRLPGVLAVLTHENCPAIRTTPVFNPGSASPGAAATSITPLQSPELHYVGQYVALVIAESPEIARHAASLVAFDYDRDAARLSFSAGQRRAEPVRRIMGAPGRLESGDPDAALAGDAITLDTEYTTGYEYHNPIEPHATVAAWTDDRRLTVYDSSQYIFGVQRMIAEAFDLTPGNVRVVCRFIGGAFGSKGLAWPHTLLAVAAAKHVGRPVRFVLTREQMYGSMGYRSPTRQRVALAADPDGQLSAIIHEGTSLTARTDEFI